MNKIVLICLVFLFASCVSSKKFNQLTSDFQKSEQTVQSLKEQNQNLKAQNTELQARVEKQLQDIAGLSEKDRKSVV